MAGFFNHQINNGMPGRSWRSFMQHIPGVGGGMYGNDNGMGMGKGMMPRRVPQPLQRAAAAGRNGDTILAHINPEELLALHTATDGMTINPKTGLPEFFSEGDGPDGTGQGGGVAGVDAGAVDNDTANAAVQAAAVAAAQNDAQAAENAAQGVGGSDADGGIMGMIQSMLTPQSLARSAIGMMMGPASPTVAHSLASVIGQGLHSTIGATDEGATAAQGVVGEGGAPGVGEPGTAANNPWASPVVPGGPPATGWTSPAYYNYTPAILGRRTGFLR